jgi:hypothetical protein
VAVAPSSALARRESSPAFAASHISFSLWPCDVKAFVPGHNFVTFKLFAARSRRTYHNEVIGSRNEVKHFDELASDSSDMLGLGRNCAEIVRNAVL